MPIGLVLQYQDKELKAFASPSSLHSVIKDALPTGALDQDQ